jgi:DNA helicase-2/ATP-dependent DNA helicase PcrA
MNRIAPSTEQQEILDLGLRTIRIRAGAGTGKTTTVAMVISNLVEEHGIEPESILGITFTNKAASELADKVRTFLGPNTDQGRQVEVHTYHGFAAQVLSEFAALAGVNSRVRVITPTFSRQLLAVTFHHTAYQHLDITNPRSLDKIRTLADRLGDHLRSPDELLEVIDDSTDIGAPRREMLETISRYNTDKRRIGVVDYADLVTLSARILGEHPDLATTIRRRYAVVVLDEYQDTNPAQRVLLSTIFTDGFPVVAVGDEDQTIYEWRGASAENFELFPDHFRDGDGGRATEKGLTLNRRSSPQILEVANEIRQMANLGAEQLHTEIVDPDSSVTTRWAEDALQEADWIARRFEELHSSGIPWREMAVLFRKNKDFAVVVDAFARQDIPLEVANLGGLLSVPEVAELRAWLTIIERPENSAALVQVLFGSSYRLGLADLTPFTRWVTSQDDGGSDDEEVVAISLLESMDQLDSVDGIRPRARKTLRHFMGVYRECLNESQGRSLVETCRLILDRTGAWQNIEALPPNQRMTARLNLYRLLDLAEDWSPLQGRPSLSAFLDHLDAMEEEPAEELDSAHLSGEDAVTLVTVHRAKGLEWDVVAIPAVTHRNFPSGSQQFPDPVIWPEHLPGEFRIDNALADLPEDDDARKEFFRERNRLQEWRVAYVAATRARKHLMVTGAYWYGLPEPTTKPKRPSELFELVAQHHVSEEDGRAEEPPRPAILRFETRGAPPDPLFETGWEGALRSVMSDPESMTRLAEELNLSDEYDQERQKLTDQLFDLSKLEAVESPDDERVVSVTGLVTYAQCPKRFYWSSVDPLPRRRNPAAVAGTELHRRIELHQRGQVPFEELSDDLYDVPGEAAGPGGFKAFLSSRFAELDPILVEAPFILRLDNDYRVRGRIDAIYADGKRWEIVDFKSGSPKDDPSLLVQLESYAVAATEVDFGPDRPEEMRVTFAFLGGGLNERTHEADDDWRNSARRHLLEITDAIEKGRFEEQPGTWCRSCDFLQFCEPGLAAVKS